MSSREKRDSDAGRGCDGEPSLHAERGDEWIRVFREGLPTPILTQHAARDRRPFIHPILAPDGVGELTENEPGHHLWQHGLYVGLNAVNGVGFWTEGLDDKTRDRDGTFHPAPLEDARLQGNSAGWRVASEWRSPGGEPMLAETQDWALTDKRSELQLDLNWTLRALTDAHFAQYPYGGLFLRMPYRAEAGGRAVNSEGQCGAKAEAKRARWTAIEMPIPGRELCAERLCSVAFLDHPSNPEHPVTWRVDGQLGVSPSRCIAAEWDLGAGESTVSQYRLLLRCGAADLTRIEREWQSFAQT